MEKKRKAVEQVWSPVQQRGEMLFFSDYLQPQGKQRKLAKKGSCGSGPRWLDWVSGWLEGTATVAMVLCGVYWIWYCMCCV